MSSLAWLQQWYFSACDGTWEHGYGINIRTLDNPGWTIEINLIGTPHEQLPEKERSDEHDDVHWQQCFLRDRKFVGYCGPEDLERTIEIFREWVAEVQ